ncbi:hypothetical protein Pan258_12670 [Symmachiella dynata]|uniref:BatA domain-containing protein n=1 Tax=Symmachiella dynata TaxID=2527995 RepID=UPI00118B6CDC|nr:BatA domain-containing protein [Symmachiella dynata]QDT47236.1 hypothetical protein Pan258_12670 [Symmachiella dynata]
MISLTTPLLLTGLTLLALPVIAHLVNRHSRQTLIFPTIALLAAVTAKHARLSRLRRLILLLLRMLAFTCIVLAFTRPVWFNEGYANQSHANDTAAVVLVLDTSASTNQRIDGVSISERMRGTAKQTLDALRSGTDVANIVLADSAPQAMFPRLTANLPGLQNELSQFQPSEERANFSTALGIAGKLLSEHTGKRDIVVISDMQAANWSDFLGNDALSEMLPKGTRVRFAEIKGAARENIALHNPQHFPSRPLADQTCDVTAQITNYSNQTKQVPVTVVIQQGGNQETTQSQTLSLSAGEQQTVTFGTTVPAAGLLTATFSIPNDDLDVDNRAYLAVETSARLPVLVVSDDDPQQPGTAAYYMMRALMPRDDQTDPYAAEHIRSRELADKPLEQYAAVFVGYLAQLSVEAAGAIVNYVDAGGGVVFFCGDGPVKENLAALQVTAGERGLLPWMPEERVRFSRQPEPLRITSGRWQSRWFREFDEQSQLAVSQIHFNQVWAAGVPDPNAEVLLMFSDGRPALGSRLFGRGQLVLAGFSPDATSSDLGKHGTFVAWMQILAKSLRPEEERFRNSPPGKTYDFPQKFAMETADGQLRIQTEDGIAVPSRTTTLADRISISLLEPQTSGIYRVTDGDRTLAAVGINVDPRESDLEAINIDRLQGFVASQGVETDLQIAGSWESSLEYTGRPLWGNCLTLAMCAIGCEMFLLGLWRR